MGKPVTRTQYGFSDLIVDSSIKLPKYIEIKDVDGNVAGDIETYFVEELDPDENQN